jgi:Cof subfamily protein (haloacid dehalogenase superfamily)
MVGYRKRDDVREESIDVGLDIPSGMFVSDLDGTLLTDERLIRAADLEALSALQGRNIVTAIATGRSYYSFNKLFDAFSFSSAHPYLPVNYVIFSTGAGIMRYPDKKILQSFSLPRQDVLEVCRYLEETLVDYMVQRPVPDTNHFVYRSHGRDNSDFNTRVKLYASYAQPFGGGGVGSLNDLSDATQVLCIIPAEDGHRIGAQISEKFPDLSVIKATSPLDHSSIWIEIFHPAVKKSSAVEWLCSHLGVVSENVCAVGNDYNDEDMLERAGAGFVTKNGPASLRKIYRGVSSNNDCAISEAVMLWLQQDNLKCK